MHFFRKIKGKIAWFSGPGRRERRHRGPPLGVLPQGGGADRQQRNAAGSNALSQILLN